MLPLKMSRLIERLYPTSTNTGAVSPMARATDNTHPATDGHAVRAIDKALLGGEPQRVGRFEYRYDDGAWTGSDTVARSHRQRTNRKGIVKLFENDCGTVDVSFFGGQIYWLTRSFMPLRWQ